MIRIHEIEFEIRFKDERKFIRISSEISSFVNYKLPYLLEQQLGRINWEEFTLRLDQLQIDLGEIREAYLQSDIQNGIERELIKLVSKYQRDISEKYTQIFKEISFDLQNIEQIVQYSTLGSEPKQEATAAVISKTISVPRIIQSRKLQQKLERFVQIVRVMSLEPSMRSQELKEVETRLKVLLKTIKKRSEKPYVIEEALASKLIIQIDALEDHLFLFAEQTIRSDPESGRPVSSSVSMTKPITKPVESKIVQLNVGAEISINERKIGGLELMDYFFKRGFFPPIAIIPDDKFEAFLWDSLQKLSSSDKKFIMDQNEEIDVFLRLQNQLSQETFERLLLKKTIEFKPAIINDNLKSKFSYLPLLDYLDALLFADQMPDWSDAFAKYSIQDVINILFHKNPVLLQNYFIQVLTKGEESEIRQRVRSLFSKSKRAAITKIIYILFSKSQRAIKMLNAINAQLDDHADTLGQLKEMNVGQAKKLISQYDFIQWLIQNKVLQQEDYQLELEEVFKIFKDKYRIKPDKNVVEILKKDPYKPKTLTKRKYKSTPKIEIKADEIILYFLQYGTIPYQYRMDKSFGMTDLKETIAKLSSHDFLNQLTGYQVIHHSALQLLGKNLIVHLVRSSTLKDRDKLIQIVEDLLRDRKSNENLADIDEELFYSFLLYYPTLKKKAAKEPILTELMRFHAKKKGIQDRRDPKKVYVLRNEVGEIHVKNAGLVLLWPFLRQYFKLLELIDDEGQFLNEEAHQRAVILSQYLATKQNHAEEHYLPLNKVLCGYPLEEPVINEIILTEKEQDVTVALLRSVIKQWKGFDQSSTDSLRGGFLIRDGILQQQGNGWHLQVERKAYDLLLDRLPWGFGKIKLPWNPYLIDVEWK